MGYSTEFKGELLFTKELTAPQLAAVNAMLGEDCRDHPEWNAAGLYYIDLELLPDFTGIRWNGAEKTYELEKIVNVISRVMRERWPDFGLSGRLVAQGEEVTDRWVLSIEEDGEAVKSKVAVSGRPVICPHCEEKFFLEDAA